MTTDDFINNTPAKMEAYKRICDGVNEDQKAISNKTTMNWIEESVQEIFIEFAHKMGGKIVWNQPDEARSVFDCFSEHLQEAHQHGVEEGRRERDEKDIKTLTELSIETGNQEYVERAKRKLIQQGAEEERKRVLEWVKENEYCSECCSPKAYCPKWGKNASALDTDDLINFINKV